MEGEAENYMGRCGGGVHDLNLCTGIKSVAMWINCMFMGNNQDDKGK